MEAIAQFQLTGKGGAPSKVDGTSDTYPHDFGSQIMSRFADAGVTDWMVGPPTRAQNLGNGYDVKTLYDFGDLSPTRYGRRQALLRQSAICKANGMGFHTMRCWRIGMVARIPAMNLGRLAAGYCACRLIRPAS